MSDLAPTRSLCLLLLGFLLLLAGDCAAPVVAEARSDSSIVDMEARARIVRVPVPRLPLDQPQFDAVPASEPAMVGVPTYEHRRERGEPRVLRSELLARWSPLPRAPPGI